MAATIHITVTNAGANIVLDGTNYIDGTTIEVYAPSGVVLAGNWHLEVTPPPIDGTTINFNVTLNTDLDLNGNTFDISSFNFLQPWITASGIFVGHQFFDAAFIGGIYFYSDFLFGGISNGAHLLPGSVPLTALANLTSAQIIVGNGSNIPTAVAVTGDVTISNAGVTAIGAGVIVNADINAAAAIALTKLAALTATKLVTTDASGFLTTGGSGVIVNADINASAGIAFSKMAALTASKVVVTSAGGVITTANQLSPALGGTGVDNSAATGFSKWNAGSQTVGAITEVALLQVSFEAGYLGDFKITMPFAGTVTSIYAYAVKVISGTDNGTIVAKNNAGTTMTAGTITYTASDARGTAYTVAPSANNTFVANDILTFTTAKTTAGGVVQLSITYTRTN